VVTTSRPELILFAYDLSVSDEAIVEVYHSYPALGHVKVCVLQRGIVGVLTCPARGLCWLIPKEEEPERRAGQVLAIFLFQLFLPALHAQNKGSKFYIEYLDGQSSTISLAET
jgi:hypothetical protein